jgi:hypothetical protein
MKRTTAWLAAAVLALLCAATGFAAPSLDDNWQPTGKSYPAGSGFKKPMAWAPGQYVVTGMTVGSKRTMVTRTLIVRREGELWIIETTTLDGKGGQNIIQIRLSGYDQALASHDPSKIAIVSMTSKDKNGKVTVMEKEQLAAFGDVMKQSYERMLGEGQAFAEGGAVTVPAGSFAGTSRASSTFAMFGAKIQMQSWYNAAVPVNGVVKSVSQDGKNVTELLSFGFDGTPKM